MKTDLISERFWNRLCHRFSCPVRSLPASFLRTPSLNSSKIAFTAKLSAFVSAASFPANINMPPFSFLSALLALYKFASCMNGRPQISALLFYGYRSFWKQNPIDFRLGLARIPLRSCEGSVHSRGITSTGSPSGSSLRKSIAFRSQDTSLSHTCHFKRLKALFLFCPYLLRLIQNFALFRSVIYAVYPLPLYLSNPKRLQNVKPSARFFRRPSRLFALPSHC